jgi:hypothetical protein
MLAKIDHVLFYGLMGASFRRLVVKPWTIVAVAAALVATAWWQWPAAAQRAAEPAKADQTITFEQYREFRLRDLQQRQTRLARQLGTPGLSAPERASIERRKAYYDQIAAMSDEERDQLFHERFDQIDTDRDGKLDPQERAAWREKKREYYRQQAAERSHPGGDQR